MNSECFIKWSSRSPLEFHRSFPLFYRRVTEMLIIYRYHSLRSETHNLSLKNVAEQWTLIFSRFVSLLSHRFQSTKHSFNQLIETLIGGYLTFYVRVLEFVWPINELSWGKTWNGRFPLLLKLSKWRKLRKRGDGSRDTGGFCYCETGCSFLKEEHFNWLLLFHRPEMNK